MSISIWCPFISEVATVKTVINTIRSIRKHSNKKDIEINLINSFGEWDAFNKLLTNLKVNIFSFNKIDKKKYLNKGGYIRSRFFYIIIFIFSFFKLHNYLKNNKDTYLFCFLTTSLPLFLNIIFNYKSKIILRISGLPKMNFIRKYFWKIISKKIYLVTCPSKETLETLNKMNIFDKEKIIFLPEPSLYLNEIKDNKFQTLVEKKFDKKNSLLCIGRLTRQKNFKFLIKSIDGLFKKYKNLNLFILGDGEEKLALYELIDKLNLNDRIFLLGYKANVIPYLRSCKCFILSSLWEDPGYVLIEAAFFNATIISSDCPNGPKSILQNGNAGYLYKSNSTLDFTKKFEEFLESTNEDILKKKINAKKGIKIYTSFHHYKTIKNYINI